MISLLSAVVCRECLIYKKKLECDLSKNVFNFDFSYKFLVLIKLDIYLKKKSNTSNNLKECLSLFKSLWYLLSKK
jgi:hypothetical protein